MIISDRFRFVFVHNPKCGGTVFRDAVCAAHDYPEVFWGLRASSPGQGLLDHAHLRLWEVRETFPDVYERLRSSTSFVFVRDPLRRFVSALHHHFRAYRQETVKVDALSSVEKLSLFRQFVRSELCLTKALKDPRYVHFSLQKWFCVLDDERVVGHILPFEDRPLEAARALLGFSLRAESWREENGMDAALLHDPELQDFVGRFYAEDYAFLSTLPLTLPAIEEPIASREAQTAYAASRAD